MELSVEQTFPPPSALRQVSENLNNRWNLTRQQWTSLSLLAIGNFGLATCSGLQAPFFPREAELKGTTPSQYGLVFGLFYLTNFIFSPVFGRLMPVVGPDYLRDSGMFVVGACFVIFGFLDKSPPGGTFLALAYLVRIVEGIGSAAYKTSNFAIVAATFPEHMASCMGLLETMFGIGLIIGPTVGGLLFELGGYELPFISSGSVLMGISILTIVALPKTTLIKKETSKMSPWKFLLDPLVILYVFLLVLGSTMIGFTQATLEPHLRQFHLTPVGVGLVFVLSGGFYGLSSTVWGYMIDRKWNPTILATISCIFMGSSYTFIGPAPFLPIDPALWLVGVSLVFLGIGYGATRVVAFVDCLRHGISRGYENNMSTYGIVSGIFNSAFGMGFFLGPTLGGICVDAIGYPSASFLLGALGYIMLLCFFVYLVWERNRGYALLKEDSPLLERNGGTSIPKSNGVPNGIPNGILIQEESQTAETVH